MKDAPSSRTQTLERLFTQARHLPYAVLRKHEDLPFDYPGHDLDILVDASTLPSWRTIINCQIVDFGWQCFAHNRRQQLEEWVLWKDNETLILQLQWEIGWRGCAFLGVTPVLAQSRLTKYGVRVVDPFHEAVISALTWLLWGGCIRRAYADQLALVAEAESERLYFEISLETSSEFSDLVLDVSRSTPEGMEGLVPRLRTELRRSAMRRHPLAVLSAETARVGNAIVVAASRPFTILIAPSEIVDDENWIAYSPLLGDAFRRVQVRRAPSIALRPFRGRSLRLPAPRGGLLLLLSEGGGGSLQADEWVNEALSRGATGC